MAEDTTSSDGSQITKVLDERLWPLALILSQKLHRLEYDDIPGEQYHYPRRYWSYIKPGECFIYYHPAETHDPRSYYFSVGRIGEVRQDVSRPDHRYAEILDCILFERPVPFKEERDYLEAKPGVGTLFFRAVRLIGQEVWDRILTRAQVDSLDMLEFEGMVQLRAGIG